MASSSNLSVKVLTSSNEYESGILEYDTDEARIKLCSGRTISSKFSSDNAFFEIQTIIEPDSNGAKKTTLFKHEIRVILKPLFVIAHQYTYKGGQYIEDIFPPSTSGFYGRLQAGREEALFVVHKIKDSSQFWLSICNPETNEIQETQIIQPYEAEALFLVDDSIIRQIQYAKSSIGKSLTKSDIFSVLDEPSLSWDELARLTEGISIPNIKLGKTMRDTLTQIVPSSFPAEIREELMAFLVYVMREEVPKDDPLDYLYKYSSTVIMEQLLNAHLIHLIDKTKPPPYVKLMILAERGQLEHPKRAITDSVKKSPWLLFSQKCAELCPSWRDIAITSAENLNKSKTIMLGLPTTKREAKKSRMSWKKRFAEISHGLNIYGHINSAALGLSELVYIGAAYRWPHRHMKFIAKLGETDEVNSHLFLQVLQ